MIDLILSHEEMSLKQNGFGQQNNVMTCYRCATGDGPLIHSGSLVRVVTAHNIDFSKLT